MMHALPPGLLDAATAPLQALEFVLPLLAWIAAGAGLWLRAILPAAEDTDEAVAIAILGYGAM